jgi:threonine dehydrogenase-like Zn-dependent dehydrogenase
MRAFVVTDRLTAAVLEVEPPVAGPGQVVVDVARAGVCGTDVELFTGEMEYLRQGHAQYPLRLGMSGPAPSRPWATASIRAGWVAV